MQSCTTVSSSRHNAQHRQKAAYQHDNKETLSGNTVRKRCQEEAALSDSPTA